MKKHLFSRFPIITVGLLLLLISSAAAQSFNFASIDFPNAIRTRASGLNPGGVIVGDYRDASGTSHGFLFSGEHYITVETGRPRTASPRPATEWPRWLRPYRSALTNQEGIHEAQHPANRVSDSYIPREHGSDSAGC